MKEILFSLKPYFYYLIGEGIKKIEVRKSCPKAKDWNNNAWFYMSKDEKSFSKIPKEYQEKYRKHFGKVGLKFTCDRIIEIGNYQEVDHSYMLWVKDKETTEKLCKNACLSEFEIQDYLGKNGGYGWHISKLKIYDKPKALSDFRKPFPFNKECVECERGGDSYSSEDCSCCEYWSDKDITRPPQSWCYVEGE